MIYFGDSNQARGVSVEDAARICQVHRTTAARWRDSERVPRACAELMRIHFCGALPPAAGAGWRGWRFGYQDGLLYAPSLTRGFDAADLYRLHWFMQQDAWRAATVRIAARAPA